MVSERNQEKPIILIVYPQPGRADEWSHAMPQYHWTDAPKQWPDGPGELPGSQPPHAIVVDAEEESDERVLRTCESLRQLEPIRETPLLVAISMYRMHLGNQVRQLPLTSILIYPVEDADIQKQLADVPHRV